ncbi:hypothetical protein DL96DRAFT_1578657 [Flagelloscypha sp. PMI_526]|nr:hypothetical protein DL96DRAFT_1578657 [Flagelloscypha sp. PMI_526]
MASTLFRKQTRHSVMIPLVSLPHIYVYPPDEDMEEPWLCFDANNPQLDPYHEFDRTEYTSNPACGFDDALFDSPPVGADFPDCDSTRALVEALVGGSQPVEAVEEGGDVPSSRRTFHHERDVSEEVVEVVKVRRSSSDENAGVSSAASAVSSERGKSIIARAFKSLKKVGKKAKPPVQRQQDVVEVDSQPSPEVPAPSTRSRRGSILRLKRSNSRPLSVRSSKSFETMANDAATPTPLPRPSSPSPSTFTARTTSKSNRRFSMLSLNKLFKSSQPSLVQPDDFTDSTTSSPPSTPQTNTFFPPIISSDKSEPALSFDDPADMSGEMRLDTLHFDDISFDANDFR